MGFFKDLFFKSDDDMFGLEINGLSKKIRKYKNTGDEVLLNSIVSAVPATLFTTYFKVSIDAPKTEVGTPVIIREGRKNYFPVFTRANRLMKWDPPKLENQKYRIQNLYISYLLDLMEDDEEYKDIAGIYINPKSEDSSIIISRKTLFMSDDDDDETEKKEASQE